MRVCMGEGGRMRLPLEYALEYGDKKPPLWKPARLSRELFSARARCSTTTSRQRAPK